MPRKARIDAPGAVHHVIIGGIERRSIFRDDLGRERFLEKLEAVLLESGSPCFAWVLMQEYKNKSVTSRLLIMLTAYKLVAVGMWVSPHPPHRS